MGKRLPPGEAERRAAERKRATWAGERYARYDPQTDGYGSFKEWARAASAFIHDDEGIEYADIPSADTTERVSSRRYIDPRLLLLGLEEMPADLAALKRAYRTAVMQSYRENGSSDTSPVYVSAFMEITKANDWVSASVVGRSNRR